MSIKMLRQSLDRSPADYLFLSEVLITLAAASLAIRILPFRVIVRIAGRPLSRGKLPSDKQLPICMRVRQAVIAWTKRLPWHPMCFPQGLATHWLLRRRGVPSVLYYGAKPLDNGGLTAHVWVCVDEIAVVGGEAAKGMGVLAKFPSDGKNDANS